MILAALIGGSLLFAPLLLAGDADNTRGIQERFIAPCCWRENLAVHQSPEAQAMRTEVTRLAASGMTQSEIVENFVARYGERILREPRGVRSVVLSAVPLLVLGLGVVLILLYLSQYARPKPVRQP